MGNDKSVDEPYSRACIKSHILVNPSNDIAILALNLHFHHQAPKFDNRRTAKTRSLQGKPVYSKHIARLPTCVCILCSCKHLEMFNFLHFSFKFHSNILMVMFKRKATFPCPMFIKMKKYSCQKEKVFMWSLQCHFWMLIPLQQTSKYKNQFCILHNDY